MVFKAFNTTGFANMAEAKIDNQKTVMFFAGDSDEASALLWIRLAYVHGHGTGFGFVMAHRQ